MENTINAAVARRMASEGRTPPTLHFLTWGKHLATNEFRDIKHVIVVGLLTYSSAQVEAMARGSGGLSVMTDFDDEAINAFHKGEIAHHVFQAVGRGAIRKTVNGDVPEGCTLHIIFPMKAGKSSLGHEILHKVFPGAKITDWTPATDMSLNENEQKLVNVLWRIATSSEDGGRATLPQLGEMVGIAKNNVWLRLEEPRIKVELARMGIGSERRQGDRRGMRFYLAAPYRAHAKDEVRVAQIKAAGRKQKRHEKHALKKAAA